MRPSDVQVVIMCKAPVAGKVKTRLMSRLTAPEAASLHAAMATTVIERAHRLFADVVIAADDPGHTFFASFGLPVVNQGTGDLGARMQVQLDRARAAGVAAVLLLGTDSPHMRDGRLLAATEALGEVDVVLGPVDDGGYDLCAVLQNQPHQIPSLFEAVAWSSEHVLTQTLSNIKRQHLSVRKLEVSFDVDFPADIERARQAGWCPAG